MKKIALCFLLLTLSFSFSFAQTGTGLPGAQQYIATTGQAPQNGTNCVQTLTFGGTPTGGTFRISFGGFTTAAITWSATNATLVANIDAALEAIPSIGSGGVTTAVGTAVAGIGTITVTFDGANVAKLVQNVMTVNDNSMTGTAPTLTIAITTPGVTADARNQPKGALLIDTANGKLYINTGSAGSPTWTVVGTQT